RTGSRSATNSCPNRALPEEGQGSPGEPVTGLPLRIEIRRDVASSVVIIGGEMDLTNAAKVRRAVDGLVDDGEDHVVVDLGGLEFIDLQGIGVLEELGYRLTN